MPTAKTGNKKRTNRGFKEGYSKIADPTRCLGGGQRAAWCQQFPENDKNKDRQKKCSAYDNFVFHGQFCSYGNTCSSSNMEIALLI